MEWNVIRQQLQERFAMPAPVTFLSLLLPTSFCCTLMRLPALKLAFLFPKGAGCRHPDGTDLPSRLDEGPDYRWAPLHPVSGDADRLPPPAGRARCPWPGQPALSHPHSVAYVSVPVDSRGPSRPSRSRVRRPRRLPVRRTQSPPGVAPLNLLSYSWTLQN